MEEWRGLQELRRRWRQRNRQEVDLCERQTRTQREKKGVGRYVSGNLALLALNRRASRANFDIWLAARSSPSARGDMPSAGAGPSAENRSSFEGSISLSAKAPVPTGTATSVLQAAKRKEWAWLKELLAKDPVKASREVDSGGWLPLHWALKTQGPPDVIAALLDANKEAAGQKTTMGKLPLHLAVTSKPDVEVVKLLLKADKELKRQNKSSAKAAVEVCLLYTSPSPRDGLLSRMPSSA